MLFGKIFRILQIIKGHIFVFNEIITTKNEVLEHISSFKNKSDDEFLGLRLFKVDF